MNFRYRFNGTYVGVRNKNGTVNPAYVNDANNTVAALTLIASDGSTERRDVPISELLIKQPRLGMIQHDDVCYYISRPIVRGYKRGFNPRVCKMIKLPTNSGLSANPRELHQNNAMIYSVYNPKYSNIQEGEELVRGLSAWSVAINPDIAVSVKRSINDPVLMYGDKVAGYVKDGVVHLHNSFDYVGEELSLIGETAVVHNA